MPLLLSLARVRRADGRHTACAYYVGTSYETTSANDLISCIAYSRRAAVAGCRNAETGSEGPKRPTVGVMQPIQRPVVEYAYFTGQIQAVESVQVRARVTGYLQNDLLHAGQDREERNRAVQNRPAALPSPSRHRHGQAGGGRGAGARGARPAWRRPRPGWRWTATKMAIDKEVAKTSGAISKLTLEEDEAKVKESEATLEAPARPPSASLEASVKAAEANLEYNQTQPRLDEGQIADQRPGRPEPADRRKPRDGRRHHADEHRRHRRGVRLLQRRRALLPGSPKGNPRRRVRRAEEQVPIDVALQNEQGYPHKGLMDLVANKLNESTGTLKVRGILKNPEKMLTPGNFVRVRLAVDKARNKLLVPDRAVIPEQGDTFLLIVGSDDKVEKRKVKIGPLDPDRQDVAGDRGGAEARMSGSLSKAGSTRGPGRGETRFPRRSEKPAALAEAMRPRRNTRTRHACTFLHRSSDLRLGHLDRHHAGGRGGGVHAAGRAISRHHAADRAGGVLVSRRQRQGGRRFRGGADRAAGQRRRAHALHVVAMHQRRRLQSDGHLRARHRPEHGPGVGAESRRVGHAAVAAAGPGAGRDREEEVAEHLCCASTSFRPTAATTISI